MRSLIGGSMKLSNFTWQDIVERHPEMDGTDFRLRFSIITAYNLGYTRALEEVEARDDRDG